MGIIGRGLRSTKQKLNRTIGGGSLLVQQSQRRDAWMNGLRPRTNIWLDYIREDSAIAENRELA